MITFIIVCSWQRNGLIDQNLVKVSSKEFITLKFLQINRIMRFTAWKWSKYGVSSGPYFPVFGLNTGKYGPEKTPYLNTFHAVIGQKDLKRDKHFSVNVLGNKYSRGSCYSFVFHKATDLKDFQIPKKTPLNHCTQKWSFPLIISLVNVTKSTGLITFTEEILNRKLYFLCIEWVLFSRVGAIWLIYFMSLVTFYTPWKH